MKAGIALVVVFLVPAVLIAGAISLRFTSGDYDPASPSPLSAWYEPQESGLSASGWRYPVAVTSGPLNPDQQTLLQSKGAEILGYLPVNGYQLRIAPELMDSVRDLPFVDWLGEIPAFYKVQPQLAEKMNAAESEVRFRIILFADEPAARVLKIVSGLKTEMSPSGKADSWRIVVSASTSQLPSLLSRLASLPEVESIEVVHVFRPMNQDGVWVHQSFVGPSPQQVPIFNKGIFGCGQIVGIADTAQDYDICYFRDTVNGSAPVVNCSFAPCPPGVPALNRRKDILYYNWSGGPLGEEDTCPATITGSSGHGTHTSGSIAGDNTPYADCVGFSTPGRNGGDGQAPGAKLIVQEMGDGLEYLNNNAGTVWNLADVSYQNGARIHSNSWGGACTDIFGECIPGCTMPYDSFARDADLAMWTYPDLLMVFSAGNAGGVCPAPISVGTPAIAKDVVSIGSVGHGTSANTPSFFSSPGPVFDGRLKPTVAAQGESVISAASDMNLSSNNCATCSLDGTSMAAPTSAGLAALVREYYTAGYFASGVRNPVAGIVPTGALIKATLIDGAVALSVQAPAPDFDSGYGRILLNSTLAFSDSPFQLRVDDFREGVVTGSVVTHAYDVSAGTPFRATLVWTDFPAALNAAIARVNELKLEVIDPAGNTWFQKLSPAGLPQQTMNPADTHDSLNVEERLVFNNPQAGRWIVRVRGMSVPMGPQPFALVVRGALADCPGSTPPNAPTLTTPADHQVLVSWTSVPGAVSYNVYRSFGACPGGPWVPVATAVPTNSYLDTTVSGGVAYSYVVTSAPDAQGFCESPHSSCASVIPTGDCFLPPVFGGILSAGSSGQNTCGIQLSWNAATPRCGSVVRYNVYRSTTPGFVPGPFNRIARCLPGSTYLDAINVVGGTNYYYKVRSEDQTSGHGGPCFGGNEDPNGVQASAAAAGPPQTGTFTDNAGDTGTAQFSLGPSWAIHPTEGSGGSKVYKATSSGGLCSDLTSPVITLADPGQGPQLSFVTRYNLEYDDIGFGAEGSVGQVEIAIGPNFSNWTRVPLTPGYPAFLEFPLNICDTTQALTTYFSGINMTYTTYTASLVNWAGSEVMIRFHISGDLIFASGNWWIDNIQITKALVPGPCTTAGSGPPPIPDGAAVPGIPMMATKNGSNVSVTWDSTVCSASEVNVYVGTIGNFTTFTSGSCELPPSGSALVAVPANAWFLVTATDGNNIDGSWGRYLNGLERIYSGASLVCPTITQHNPNSTCP